jgi:pimeloyl-ACP methyl ester carboxylesterase
MGEHGTMTWWDPQLLAALSAQFTVTIFDLPGVGYSASAPSSPTLDIYADPTAGLILALGLETTGVDVVGWGLGGDVALDAEIRHPGIERALVLLHAPAPGNLDVRSAPAASAFASPVATTVGLSRYMFPAALPDVQSAWLQRIGQISPDDMTAAAVADQAGVVAAVPHDSGLMNSLHSVHIPVDVITGKDDVVVPEVNAIRLARSIPKAQLLEIPGAGYASVVSAESQFSSTLASLAR